MNYHIDSDRKHIIELKSVLSTYKFDFLQDPLKPFVVDALNLSRIGFMGSLFRQALKPRMWYLRLTREYNNPHLWINELTLEQARQHLGDCRFRVSSCARVYCDTNKQFDTDLRHLYYA